MNAPGDSNRGASDHWQVTLVALSALISLQAVRVFFPIVFDLGEKSGKASSALSAGLLSLVVFLSPIMAPALARLLGPWGSLRTAIALLAVVRLAIQLVHPIPLWLAVAATAIALVTLAMLLVAVRGASADGGHRYVRGLLLGMAVDTALRTAFSTWDYAWQGGVAPVLLALVTCLPLAVLGLSGAGGLAASGESGAADARSAVLVGPFLLLQVLFLQSVAFVASQAGVGLSAAAAIVLVGDVLAIVALSSLDRPARLTRAAMSVALILLVYLLRQLDDAGVALLIVLAQVVAVPLLATGLDGRMSSTAERAWHACLWFAVGTLAFMLLVVLYQIVYRVKLPVPNTLIAPIAALLLATAGWSRSDSRLPVGGRPARFAVGVTAAFILVPIGLALFRARPAVEAGPGRSVRMLDYNIHLAIDSDGQLDPELVARTIEGERPDVVALQEVARGWAGAGTTDLAEWLSSRLRMRFVYAPAADGQFGNVLLTRFPIRTWGAVTLPRASGAQDRSYLRAVLDIGGGQRLTVIDAHLEGDQPDHRRQVGLLLDDWGKADATAIAGDMNMQPGDPDVGLFEAAGLVSTQDATGNGSLTSATNPKFPGDRPDWIFGSPDLSFADFRIPRSTASDHLPLSVMVSLS